jgi:ABC-type multidrug transport system ATPase subunit
LAIAPGKTGFAPEQADLPDFLTVSETLEYSCALSGKELSAEQTRQILADLQLTAYKDEQTQNLSKGNRQRLSLAASIAHEPELLIFDEPASGLDPIGRKLVKDLMKKQKAKGTTIFFTTHILTDLAELCDYIGFIHQGKMIFSGTPDDLFKSSANASIEEIFISLISQNQEVSEAEAT